MPRIVHFEIPVDDPERAIKFYEQALGWKISKWGGPMDYWLVQTGESGEPGVGGAIMRRGDVKSPVNTVDVPSFEEYAQKVTEAGGKLLMDKQAILGIGYFAYCVDTEGNLFGILEPEMAAK